MAKPASVDTSPQHEPTLRVVKSRKRRAARAAAPARGEPSVPGSLKPLLIGIGVGSAVVLAATALQASARQGARPHLRSQPSLWNALTKTVAVALAQMVAKKVGRDLAERALPALAGRAIVALSKRRSAAA